MPKAQTAQKKKTSNRTKKDTQKKQPEEKNKSKLESISEKSETENTSVKGEKTDKKSFFKIPSFSGFFARVIQKKQHTKPSSEKDKKQENNQHHTQALQNTKFTFLPKLWQKIVFAVFLLLVFLTTVSGVIGYYTYTVALDLKQQAVQSKDIAYRLLFQFNEQNLDGAESELQQLKETYHQMRNNYSRLRFYNSLPITNKYYQDGLHAFNAAGSGIIIGEKSIGAIRPYADILGFTGNNDASDSAETAENRIKIVLETLDKVTPVLDDITAEINTMQSEIDQIDPNRYPEEFNGIKIRDQIVQVKKYGTTVSELMVQFRPVLERAPEIAGANGERKKYLVMFTNDGELRPTGGFMTAYSIIWVEDGKVYPDVSDDIYVLDSKLPKKEKIPEQLGRYLTTEKYFNLRDMNIYPDFKQSMKLFYENYQKIPGSPEDISGIIAIDTHVLVDLLKILGPVELPGYGTFTAEPYKKDLPQVVYALSEIITRPTPYIRDDRKGILGPMMNATLVKSYQAPDSVWPQLFEMAVKNLEQRHIQMYFTDQEIQTAIEAINAGGRMIPPENGQDFLAVINANLGGAKSNFFTSSEMTQTIEEKPSEGMLTKIVEITYKNDQEADNCNLEAGLLCLNASNRDWTRIYIPQGSELIDAQGFNQETLVHEENGFTVIEGFFILEPMGQAKLKFTYKIPYSDQDTYRVNLWKQGGIDPVPVLMEVTGGQEEVLLDKDKTYSTQF